MIAQVKQKEISDVILKDDSSLDMQRGKSKTKQNIVSQNNLPANELPSCPPKKSGGYKPTKTRVLGIVVLNRITYVRVKPIFELKLQTLVILNPVTPYSFKAISSIDFPPVMAAV